MELFAQYQPLFAEAINSNRIGVCKWIESGTTIDTALPELSSLTDDKEAWRAVIVRYVDESPMAAFRSDPRNPFDFLVNKEAKEGVEESPIPLVRLTQMLGGVPPLEVSFRPEVVREKHKAPRTVYVPVEDARQKLAHRLLTEKYQFDGRPPASVLIISIRDKVDEGIGKAWAPHKESDSSEFWKRNRFPSVCRFMAFDFSRKGPIQKAAEDFQFWYSVMLMATNDWDSSTLQAYRLYSVSLEMDKAAMAMSFQTLADRLRDAKLCLEKSIKTDIENQVCQEEKLPDYKIRVAVAPKLPNTDRCSVKSGSFGLLSRGATSDVAIWSRQRNELEERFSSAVRTAERTLDQTADRMRSVCSLSEDEVTPLNRYQIEDMTRETDALYRRIVEIQSQLPKGNMSTSEEVASSARKVKENLLGRVVTGPAFAAVGIVLALAALAAVPAFIQSIREDAVRMEMIGIALGLCALVVGACALGALLLQKGKLDRLIGIYNQHMRNAFNKLVDNADTYTDYMSGIASHARGRSYLELTRRKKHSFDMEHFAKYKHIKAINILLGKLGTWSKAFRLDVDLAGRRPEAKLEVDISVAPAENKLYLFDTTAACQVAVNNSGMTMQAPYCFAKKIQIIREELYENE